MGYNRRAALNQYRSARTAAAKPIRLRENWFLSIEMREYFSSYKDFGALSHSGQPLFHILRQKRLRIGAIFIRDGRSENADIGLLKPGK